MLLGKGSKKIPYKFCNLCALIWAERGALSFWNPSLTWTASPHSSWCAFDEVPSNGDGCIVWYIHCTLFIVIQRLYDTHRTFYIQYNQSLHDQPVFQFKIFSSDSLLFCVRLRSSSNEFWSLIHWYWYWYADTLRLIRRYRYTWYTNLLMPIHLIHSWEHSSLNFTQSL